MKACLSQVARLPSRFKNWKGELSSQKTTGYLNGHSSESTVPLQPESSRRGNIYLHCCLQSPPGMGSFPTDPHLARERTKLSRGNISYRGTIKVPAYREELELERLLWRRRPGDRDLLRTGDLRLGERDLLLIRGGDLRHMGGGGSILLGGLNRRGGGRGQGANTAVAVISWPSICPPSMCFSAFSASSGFSNSTYA